MSTIQRIRVPVGFAYTALYIYAAQPVPRWYWSGLLVAMLGLALRVWAAGCLKKFEMLTISGPYSWSQNPLYLGSFLIGLGFAVAGSRPWLVGIFLIVFGAVYIPVMRREEAELWQAYGSPYDVYRRHVPRFFPRPWKRGSMPPQLSPSDVDGFAWRRVMSNGEYRAAIGFLMVAAGVFLKMRLL